jgi:methylenetetrahydrofolate reductase (NADPH)
LIRSESRLERLLHEGVFCVTAEVVPPRSADPGPIRQQAEALVGYADAVNVTDNPTGAVHMSSQAGVAAVAAAGLEPVMQLTCRDRNRLGVMSDLLGGWALGARNVLCLTGDPTSLGDHPEAKAVFDLTVTDLVALVARMRDGLEPFDPPPRYGIGVADLPLDPHYDPGRLDQKIDAGADFVQTQIVYDVDAFGEWADAARARGVLERVFIIVGVAPPRGPRSARYMRDHLPGVLVPDRVIDELEAAGAGGAAAAGVQLTVDIVRRLKDIEGIAGVHVMGMGHEDAVRQVIEQTELLPRPTVG